MSLKDLNAASSRSIRLVENGIFPITIGSNGESLYSDIDTGFNIPGTIQGEGKLLGTPCLFIRTSTCNLNCSWVGSDGNGSTCDTVYSSHFPENNRMNIDDVVKVVTNNIGNMKHIVISGGEPMLQGRRLYELMVELKMSHNIHITVETNGTIYLPDVATTVDLVSISPKLSSSTPWADNLLNTGINYNENIAKTHEKKRINLAALQRWIDWRNADKLNRDFQFKFVVSKPDDVKEIQYTLSQLVGWNNDDICLMPEGVTPDDLMTKTDWVVKLCVENGYRFTPRLHALIWGVKRGV